MLCWSASKTYKHAGDTLTNTSTLPSVLMKNLAIGIVFSCVLNTPMSHPHNQTPKAPRLKAGSRV